MKTLSPDDVLKNKSHAAANHRSQASKTPSAGSGRPGTALQHKMQAAADNSPQVTQLQALQAMADRHVLGASHQKVVQRIQGFDEITNTYSEVKIDNKKYYTTNVDGLDRTEKTLAEGELEGEKVRTSEEVGYRVLELEENEKKKDWIIMDSVLEWKKNTLCTRNNFNLPVSCIESAEHVIHHHAKGDEEIPDHNPKNKKKNVGLFFGEVRKKKIEGEKRKREITTNHQVANLDGRDLINVGLKWKDYDFASKPVKVGEGLFVQNIDDRSKFHAVAVVGKKGNRIIVLERNAGETTGDNMYVDNRWLVNVYDNENDFKEGLESDGGQWRIGKLKAL